MCLSLYLPQCCNYDFWVFVQVCQVLQQGWSGVPNTCQGLRYSLGCHCSRTCELNPHRPSSVSSDFSQFSLYCLTFCLFQAGKFSPIPTIISTVTAMTSVGIVSNSCTFVSLILGLILWFNSCDHLCHNLFLSLCFNLQVYHHLWLDHADVYR